jgi:uncharacterized protein
MPSRTTPVPAPSPLQQQQAAFAAHLRDPGHAPAPEGIEDRRLAIYRDLVFANLEGLLRGSFPIASRVLGEAAWQGLVRAFLRDHRATTPLFHELPREFVHFIETRAGDAAGDPPWLAELAHYEWIEVALEFAEAEPLPATPDTLDPLAARLDVSPLAWPLAYAWPVHRLREDYLPAQPPAQPTFLLIQRDAAGRVRFHEIGAVAFHLLERVGSMPVATGAEHLRALAAEAGADPGEFIALAAPLLRDLFHARALGSVID